jgi:hypothetical protein
MTSYFRVFRKRSDSGCIYHELTLLKQAIMATVATQTSVGDVLSDTAELIATKNHATISQQYMTESEKMCLENAFKNDVPDVVIEFLGFYEQENSRNFFISINDLKELIRLAFLKKSMSVLFAMFKRRRCSAIYEIWMERSHACCIIQHGSREFREQYFRWLEPTLRLFKPHFVELFIPHLLAFAKSKGLDETYKEIDRIPLDLTEHV